MVWSIQKVTYYYHYQSRKVNKVQHVLLKLICLGISFSLVFTKVRVKDNDHKDQHLFLCSWSFHEIYLLCLVGSEMQ